jgi:hypothetical protein
MDHPTSTTIKRTYGGLHHLKVTFNKGRLEVAFVGCLSNIRASF